jgi:hypothetical protein
LEDLGGLIGRSEIVLGTVFLSDGGIVEGESLSEVEYSREEVGVELEDCDQKKEGSVACKIWRKK